MGNPQNLLKGHGCLQCSGTREKTTEEFIEKLRLINDKIQIIGKYENAHTKIECLCRNCGCEFVKAPKKLLRGQGCPWCAGKRNSVNIIKKPYK